MSLSIEDVTDAAGFAALEPEWRRLFERDGRVTPFQSWEWVEAWWRHHGSGTPWVLVAREDGVGVGIMPLVITRYRATPLRQVRWMGAPLSDYQGLVCEPGREDACAAAFLAHLSTERARWDVCDLNDLREGDPVQRSVPGELSADLALHRQCPVIALGASWDGYLKTLGRNLRQNVGRRRRQLEKHYSTTLETADSSTLEASMEALYRLHNTRWRRRGASGAFSGKRMQAFHHEVARRFLQRGWLRLHRLVCDGEIRAAFYCFQLRGRVYYYLSGFDHAIGKFSPGNVMMAFTLERAIAEGARELDLLRGDEEYKYQWKAADRATERLVLGHDRFRSRFAVSGHRFERWVEHEGLKVQRRLWGRSRPTGAGAGSARLPEPDAS